MKLKLDDPANRVSRLLHRTAPGGELVIVDLRFGYRGELFCSGRDDRGDFVEIRCRSTRSEKWDPATEGYLVAVSWRGRRLRVLHAWSKGTLELLLCPLDKWMPSAAKKWTCLKESFE